jgi:methionyl-tRNA formyltransferase
MVQCGILVNNFDYYLPFIEFFIKLQSENKISIISVICNEKNFIKLNFPDLKLKIIEEEEFPQLIRKSEIVFSLGYWKKINKESINKVKFGIVNIHNSYKLKYRGRHMSFWVIINNEKVHGTTIHYMNEKIDDGKIIDTSSFEIEEDDTSYSLNSQANTIALELLKKNIDKILTGKVNNKISKSSKYYYYKEKDLCHEIPSELLKSPKKLLRNIRALSYPNKPKPYLLIDSKKVFLEIDNNI